MYILTKTFEMLFINVQACTEKTRQAQMMQTKSFKVFCWWVELLQYETVMKCTVHFTSKFN